MSEQLVKANDTITIPYLRIIMQFQGTVPDPLTPDNGGTGVRKGFRPLADPLSGGYSGEVHPFPFRTRKLSSPAPKILGGQLPGKIGRRQIKLEGRSYY